MYLDYKHYAHLENIYLKVKIYLIFVNPEITCLNYGSPESMNINEYYLVSSPQK